MKHFPVSLSFLLMEHRARCRHTCRSLRRSVDTVLGDGSRPGLLNHDAAHCFRGTRNTNSLAGEDAGTDAGGQAGQTASAQHISAPVGTPRFQRGLFILSFSTVAVGHRRQGRFGDTRSFPAECYCVGIVPSSGVVDCASGLRRPSDGEASGTAHTDLLEGLFYPARLGRALLDAG